jgi:hypothetical protein
MMAITINENGRSAALALTVRACRTVGLEGNFLPGFTGLTEAPKLLLS